MTRKNNTQLTIPSFSVKFNDKGESDFVRRLLDQNIHGNFFIIMVKKILSNPKLMTSDNNEVTESTNSSIATLTQMVSEMNREQTAVLNQLKETNDNTSKIMEEMGNLMQVNDMLHSSLTEILKVLSESQEGLSILKTINENKSLDITKVVEKSIEVKEQSERVLYPVKEFARPVISTDPLDNGDELEDEDDFFDSGLSEEELHEIASTFRAGGNR